MRYTKRFAGLALSLGMLIGAGTLSAADWRNTYRSQAQWNQDANCERPVAVVPETAYMVRDRQPIIVQRRDNRHDRRDVRRYHDRYDRRNWR